MMVAVHFKVDLIYPIISLDSECDILQVAALRGYSSVLISSLAVSAYVYE